MNQTDDTILSIALAQAGIIPSDAETEFKDADLDTDVRFEDDSFSYSYGSENGVHHQWSSELGGGGEVELEWVEMDEVPEIMEDVSTVKTMETEEKRGGRYYAGEFSWNVVGKLKKATVEREELRVGGLMVTYWKVKAVYEYGPKEAGG